MIARALLFIIQIYWWTLSPIIGGVCRFQPTCSRYTATCISRFGAAQGGFSEALLALSNHEVLAKVAEAMSVQAFVGGKTLTDVIDKVFAGTPLAGVMDKVKARVATNGHALPVG